MGPTRRPKIRSRSTRRTLNAVAVGEVAVGRDLEMQQEYLIVLQQLRVGVRSRVA